MKYIPNIDGTIISLLARGQITIPKAYRDELGITAKTPLNIIVKDDGIVIKPLMAIIREMKQITVKPKVNKEDYLKIIKNMKGVHWTGKDDIKLQKMRKKEKIWEI